MKAFIFDKYVDGVENHFQLDKGDLFKKSRRRKYVDARYLLYYLCKKRNMSITYIQEYMKEKGFDVYHSAIINGINIMKQRVEDDIDLNTIIDKIKKS